MSGLTEVQRAYIWLAGSYPTRILVQGRGYRGRPIKFGLDEDGEELVVFGYSNPVEWLERRGIFRRLQDYRSYTLTEAGEEIFRKMHRDGEGLDLNRLIREVRIAPRSPS